MMTEQAPPPPPPPSQRPPRIIVIGAGSRGRAYARAVRSSSNGVVVAVAEPDDFKREAFGREFIWGDVARVDEEKAARLKQERCFAGWSEFVSFEMERRRHRWPEAKQRQACSGVSGSIVESRVDITTNGKDGGEGHNYPYDEDEDEGVDAALVCVLDHQHLPCVRDLAPLGLHIMCEKPLATTLSDCVELYRIAKGLQTNPPAHTPAARAGAVFGIGHVLRYSPHNMTLRRLLLDERVVGDLLSVVHTEPVGWWHFAHSYVRGNWRREDTSAPSLLTKSCHDMDILLWLLCEQPQGDGKMSRPHLPKTVTATGSLQFFRRARKPVAAGSATNCLSCPAEEACAYSAKKIYVTSPVSGLDAGNVGWPVKIVLPEIEDLFRSDRKEARRKLLVELAQDYDNDAVSDAVVRGRNWFGRCVFEADNDVCDEEVVTITWDDDVDNATTAAANGVTGTGTADSLAHRGAKTATFHMVSHTRQICERYTHVYGTLGELEADSRTISLRLFSDPPEHPARVIRPYIDPTSGHGGGDSGLIRQFVLAVDMVKNHSGGDGEADRWTAERAQREVLGCTLDEILRAHALVFAAEESRRTGVRVDWAEWWSREIEGSDCLSKEAQSCSS